MSAPISQLNVPQPSEVELILSCARLRVEQRGVERVQASARRELDWDLLVRMAYAHGMVPLLYHVLSTACAEAVPREALEQLRDYFRTNARRNLALASELVRLLALFRARDIRAIPFKGPIIAATAYRDLMLRPIGDLDILVSEQELPRATEVLVSQGYDGRFGWDWATSFVREGGVEVDLHARFGPPWDPRPASFDALWSRRRSVPLVGTTVLTAAPEDLLLILSIQFLRDCRARRRRLIQICDTAMLIRSHPELDWAYLLEVAGAAGARRALLLDVLLADSMLGAGLPPLVEQEVRRDRVARQLANEVEGRFFEPERADARWGPWRWDTPLYLRARERVRDKIAYLGPLIPRLLRFALTPTDRDQALVRLPSRLGFLYYLVRPVRILRQWMRTGEIFARSRRRAFEQSERPPR